MARAFICALTFLISIQSSIGQQLDYSWFARAVAIDTCSQSVVVDNRMSIEVGDIVGIHQTQVQNSTEEKIAGHLSTFSVEAIIDQELYLRGPSLATFDINGTVQVFRVLTGSHVVLTNVNIPPFSNKRGGLFVVMADTIEIQGRVSAVGAGYRGGRMSLAGCDTSVVGVGRVTQEKAGQPGESWSLELSPGAHGRLNNFSGGGGGNARNAGGGGGGCFSSGGSGGHQTSEFPIERLGGQPGIAQASTETSSHVIHFGGGGGGGHQNDFLGSNGGAGGGAIFLQCSVLVSSNEAIIDASGAIPSLALIDGAGGGGAGGVVIIDANTAVGSLVVHAKGAEGGSVVGRSRCYGPGGGGAGGIIRSTIEITSNVQGGDAGVNIGGDEVCTEDSSYGAISGEVGTVVAYRYDVPKIAVPCGRQIVEVTGLNAKGLPGDQVGIEVEIAAPFGLDRNVIVELKVQTRATTLVPIGAFWWAGSLETSRYTRKGLPAGPAVADTVVLPYHVALGDSATVQIAIDSAWSDNADVQIVRHGRFVLEDICVSQSGVRLFDYQAPQTPAIEYYNVLGQMVTQPNKPMYIKRPTSFGSQGSVLLVPR